jgi:pyroglutamyl-peptidase
MRTPRGAGERAGVRVLATGFGPFPGVPDNPSATIVARLGDVAGARLVRHRLATEWAALDGLAALFARVRPRIAVHVGVAARARRVRIEAVAVAACDPTVDAAGRLPPSAENLATTPRRRVHAATAALAAAARTTGAPAGVSGDAGRYLCNALLYRSLVIAETAARPHLAVFVHVPQPAPIRGRRLEDLVAAVQAVVEELVRRSRPPRRRQPKSRSRAV